MFLLPRLARGRVFFYVISSEVPPKPRICEPSTPYPPTRWKTRNFFSSTAHESRIREHMIYSLIPSYFPHISSCFLSIFYIFSSHFLNFLSYRAYKGGEGENPQAKFIIPSYLPHISSYFLHIFHIFPSYFLNFLCLRACTEGGVSTHKKFKNQSKT